MKHMLKPQRKKIKNLRETICQLADALMFTWMKLRNVFRSRVDISAVTLIG